MDWSTTMDDKVEGKKSEREAYLFCFVDTSLINNLLNLIDEHHERPLRSEFYSIIIGNSSKSSSNLSFMQTLDSLNTQRNILRINFPLAKRVFKSILIEKIILVCKVIEYDSNARIWVKSNRSPQISMSTISPQFISNDWKRLSLSIGREHNSSYSSIHRSIWWICIPKERKAQREYFPRVCFHVFKI